MKKIITLFALGMVLISCDSSPKKKFIGTWKVTYENFELNSYKNQDTVFSYDIDYTNPGEKRAKEIKYYRHEADSVLVHWTVRSGSNRKSTDPNGKWYVNQDTLVYEFSFGAQKMVYKMAYKFSGKNYEATVKSDFDRDGANDDIYTFEAKPVKE